MKDTRDYMCQNCGSGFSKKQMVFGDDVDLCTSCSSYEKGKAYLVQAEDGEHFQKYFDEDGNRIPTGEDVGVEILVDGYITFFLLEGVYFP